MLELLLIRHGQTDWNVSRMMMGRKPIPLNDVGMEQAKRLADFLKGSDLKAIITSPVKRAYQTAEAIANHYENITPLEHEALTEIDYGDWVGKSFDEVIESDREIWDAYHISPDTVKLPGGESMVDVKKRVADLLGDVRSKYKNGRVALVSHADVLKVAILELMDMDLSKLMKFSVDNCAVILIRFQDGFGPRFIAYNAMNGFGNDL